VPGLQTILDLRKVFGVTLIYDANQAAAEPFDAEMKFIPGAKSALHTHPQQEEHYKIIVGELEIFLDDKWIKLGAGEELLIPKGAKHSFRNKGTQKAVVINKHIPGLRTQEFFETTQRLILEGKINGMTGFKNSIYHSLLVMKFSDMIVLNKPSMALIKLGAFVGKILRYKV
jgi:mannose-6-phosphate isomerase-like protein (cupin superfamily)